MINELAIQIHENNVSKGFYDSEKNIGEMLCLIHSEVSEALECDRKGKYSNIHRVYDEFDMATTYDDLIRESDPIQWESLFKQEVKDTFEDELADIMIRCMDLAAYKEIDLEAQIKLKMKYNSMRPHKHGKKY